jgi:hypothetical protein
MSFAMTIIPTSERVEPIESRLISIYSNCRAEVVLSAPLRLPKFKIDEAPEGSR